MIIIHYRISTRVRTFRTAWLRARYQPMTNELCLSSHAELTNHKPAFYSIEKSQKIVKIW